MAKSVAVGQKHGLLQTLKRYKWLYIMLLPGIIYYIVFKFYPATNLIIVFQDYFPTLGISGSPWVGLDNSIASACSLPIRFCWRCIIWHFIFLCRLFYLCY